MKNQGTLTKIVDHINRIWPFKETIFLIEDKVNEIDISIKGNVDFTFEILVGDFKYISQPVVFSVLRYSIFCVTWDFDKKDPIKFYLDGQEVNSLEIKADKLVITHSPTSYVKIVDDEFKNFDDSWEIWRRDLFNIGKGKLKEKRVFKSIDEQFEELRLSIFSLEAGLINFKENEKLLLFNILPILRSLLFWYKTSSNYNPLLLRLAGFLNHSLRVYSLSEDAVQDIPDFKNGEIQFLYLDSVSLNKLSSNHKLTDFQEWLIAKVIFEKSEFSNKDIIGLAANTMSFTHFDVDTYIILKDLIDKKFLQTSMLLDIIIQITHLSIHFGHELLKMFDEKKTD